MIIQSSSHAYRSAIRHRSPVIGPHRISALVAGTVVGVVGVWGPAAASPDQPSHEGDQGHGYVQSNLVSDQPGVAALTDPHLVNPWGLSAGPTTPIWVSDNGADVSTLYSGDTAGLPVKAAPLVVSIPDGAPTGQVFNDTTSFVLPDGTPARFLFASESGTLTGWNPQLKPITSAVTVATSPDAVYKGLALLHTNGSALLLAADFHHGRIDVFDSSFDRVPLTHRAFNDPRLPRGYAPFNVAVVGDRVFVTYARQNALRHDDVAGEGHGFIDVYAPNGALVQRFARRGVLNSPWGLAIAPAGFGQFSGDLLVGNFGDGLIHAFDPMTGELLGAVEDRAGNAIRIDGLWGLLPGNGVASDPAAVWFSAGPNQEKNGLLGTLRLADRSADGS
jgi:uncharacterized protein (TIGR03118 family)